MIIINYSKKLKIYVNKFNLAFPSKTTTNHLPCLLSTATLVRYHQPLVDTL